MGLFLVFLLGIANFAALGAWLHSGHPLLRRMPVFSMFGGKVSMALEFVMLVGAMLATSSDSSNWVWAYAGYTAMNIFSAWLVHSGRV